MHIMSLFSWKFNRQTIHARVLAKKLEYGTIDIVAADIRYTGSAVNLTPDQVKTLGWGDPLLTIRMGVNSDGRKHARIR